MVQFNPYSMICSSRTSAAISLDVGVYDFRSVALFESDVDHSSHLKVMTSARCFFAHDMRECVLGFIQVSHHQSYFKSCWMHGLPLLLISAQILLARFPLLFPVWLLLIIIDVFFSNSREIRSCDQSLKLRIVGQYELTWGLILAPSVKSSQLCPAVAGPFSSWLPDISSVHDLVLRTQTGSTLHNLHALPW